MVLKGKSVCEGYAYGRITVYNPKEVTVVRRKIGDIEAEIARFVEAKEVTKTQYEQLYEKALKEVGNNNASLFKAEIVLLDDMDYFESVSNIIRTQGVNAEYAVAATIDNFAQMMGEAKDEYIKERVKDVREVFDKVIENLSGENKGVNRFDEPVILLAQDLTPSDIVQLDKTNIRGFVIGESSSNSHTAILSKGLNLPSLIGVYLLGYVDEDKNVIVSEEISPWYDGKMAIINGYTGELIVEPSHEEVELYKARMELEEKNKELLNELKGKETVTQNGVRIHLYANINSEKEVADALKNDAEGIGLFRTEYLYMGRENAPSEEEQFAAYRLIAQNMGGKRVIIRTTDIGADKQVPYMDNDVENNPALGYRGIRQSLDNTEMFKTQLRAIFRAGYYGNIAVMFPLITSVEEVTKIKKLVTEVKQELDELGIPYKDCELGVMIETPAAVMISDILAKEVDFFSIGTNDLSQYTFAIDRTNTRLEKYYNPKSDAIMRQIKITADNAHECGCKVGICGDLATDIEAVQDFVRMGIDDISVPPSYILSIRDAVRKM